VRIPFSQSFRLLAALAVAGCAQESTNRTSALKCLTASNNEFQLLFEPTDGTARLITVDGPVAGRVSAQEAYYEFSFPPSEGRFETRVLVQRFSGALNWEHGSPPFGKASEKNVRWLGKCEKINATPPI
jgi:hypothetical protein